MKAKLLISLALIGIILVSGCAAGKPATLSVPSVAAGEVSNPKLALGSHYELNGFTITLTDSLALVCTSKAGIISSSGNR